MVGDGNAEATFWFEEEAGAGDDLGEVGDVFESGDTGDAMVAGFGGDLIDIGVDGVNAGKVG